MHKCVGDGMPQLLSIRCLLGPSLRHQLRLGTINPPAVSSIFWTGISTSFFTTWNSRHTGRMAASTSLIIGLSVGLGWFFICNLAFAAFFYRRRRQLRRPTTVTGELTLGTDPGVQIAATGPTILRYGFSDVGFPAQLASSPERDQSLEFDYFTQYSSPSGAFDPHYSIPSPAAIIPEALFARSRRREIGYSPGTTSYATVAPRDVEYGPNPAIFPGLWAEGPSPIISSGSQRLEKSTGASSAVGASERFDETGTTSPSLSPEPPRQVLTSLPLTRDTLATHAESSPEASSPVIAAVHQCPHCSISFDKAYLMKYLPLS